MSNNLQSVPETTRPGFSTGSAVAIIFAGVVVALFLFFYRSDEVANVPTPSPSPAVAGALDIPVVVPVTALDPQLGNKQASVQVIEFADFDCHYCREFHRDTFPQLREAYIDQGLLHYVHKDFPLQQSDNPQSVAAAQAARCADEQDAFWEYATALYTRDELTPPVFPEIAASIKLDLDIFQTCLAAAEQADAVITGVQEAIAAGVTATPAFIINGQLYEGALSFSEIAALVAAGSEGGSNL